MNEPIEVSVTIENERGMHARAATVFVQLASEFEADVFVSKDGREVNGKSIMGVLMLVATKGSRITLRAEGPDAEEAIAALCALVKNRFGEGN